MVAGIAHLAKDVKGGELWLKLLAQHGNCVLYSIYHSIILLYYQLVWLVEFYPIDVVLLL